MRIIIKRPAVDDMQNNTIDMNLDGSFAEPRGPAPLATRIFRTAILIATLAAGLAIAAFAVWFALLLIPIALAAGAIAWVAWRFQLWRGPRRH